MGWVHHTSSSVPTTNSLSQVRRLAADSVRAAPFRPSTRVRVVSPRSGCGGALCSPLLCSRQNDARACTLGTGSGDTFRTRRDRTVSCQGNTKGHFAELFQSPLTDSNRRPPPYHGGPRAV